MLEFMIGLFVGGFVGVFLMACLNAASHEDERFEKLNKNNKEDNTDV